MTDNVHILRNVTRINIPIERVLNEAKEVVDEGIVIGWDKDGEFYFSSSYADGGEVLWLIEKAKHMLMTVED